LPHRRRGAPWWRTLPYCSNRALRLRDALLAPFCVLAARGSVRAPEEACWCALTTLELTLTTHSTSSPTASDLVSARAPTNDPRCAVPPPSHKPVVTGLCHGPRSVPANRAKALRGAQLPQDAVYDLAVRSCHWPPRWGRFPSRSGAIRSQALSVSSARPNIAPLAPRRRRGHSRSRT
jgi:hypothetical protein